MSKLIHIKSNDSKSLPHINNYSTRGIIHDTRKISNDPTCGRVKKLMLIALLAVMGSCPLSCGILSTANNSAHAVGTEVHFGVNVPDVPVLEIILKDGNDEVIDGGTEMDVTPTMAYAGFNTADVNVTVGTSSNGGYNLKMLVDNSSVVSQNNLSGINSNALVSAEGNTIETLGENPETPFTCSAATATTCNFTVNSWGYRLSTDAENTYKAVPQAETELLNYTDGATNGVTTSLGFGVRANAKQAGGYYETTLNFIATANPETTISMLTHMQDFAVLSDHELEDVVRSMNEEQSYTLIDSRDNKTYNIAKLKGGNVWLQDNLQLDIAANKDNITSANTNANNDALTCLKSGCSSSTTYSKVAAANTNSSNWSGSNRFTQAMYNTEYADYDASYGNGTHKSGYYYNYCAASAGSYCYAEDAGTGNASQDICPAGWQMPAGYTSTYSYHKLYRAYSNVADFKNALHVGLSGVFAAAGVVNQGSLGYFWASTFYNTHSMRNLAVSASSVTTTAEFYRSSGYSVRCVLKTDPLSRAGVSTMQDMATLTENEKTSLLASMPEGKSYTLTDTRDNASESYEIAKLADGKVWMLENLRLGKDSTIDLTPADTNIASNYTLPASGTDNFDSTNGYTNAAINISQKTEVGSGSWKYGVYYNYCAASAGDICVASDQNNNASYDICPAGWRMPTGGSSGEYRALTTALTGISTGDMKGDNYTTVVNALHLPLSGGFYNGSPYDQGSNGDFWASTRTNYVYTSCLFLNTSTVVPFGSLDRTRGYSVRCVMKTE